VFKRIRRWWSGKPTKVEMEILRRLHYLQESVDFVVDQMSDQPMPDELKQKLAQMNARRKALQDALALSTTPIFPVRDS